MTVAEAADEAGGRDLASRILDPGRHRPLVAVSTQRGRGALIDPHALAGELGEAAEVWLIETGPATWALADDLPDRLEVFGGAVRIWWPRARWDAVPEDHPLLFVRDPAGADRVRSQVASLVARDAFRRGGASAEGAAVEPPPAAADPTLLAREVAALTTELHAAAAEHEQLADQLRQERTRSQALARRLRVAEERLATLERAEAAEDPLADDEAFLRGVATAYDRIYGDADKEVFPLGRMAVGPGFLESARTLEGIDRARILEVCAHVAAGRAWHISGLRVHPLRSGRGGAPQRRRPGGARAWRCALQVGSPAARRLHWWAIPGPGGGTVEFDSVGTHDDGLG